jgi:hypothetical protein
MNLLPVLFSIFGLVGWDKQEVTLILLTNHCICHQFQMSGSRLVSLLNLLPCFKTLSFGDDAWYNQEIIGDKNDMHTAISRWYLFFNMV